MTIEGAIKHYEEVAEKEERSAKLHPRPDKDVKGSGKKYLICLERAEEHRQLAEWLRELKKLREQTEPRKCGDCISRRAIIGKCEDTAEATSDIGEMNTGFIMALDFIADYAKHMPSVESERKPGKWIPRNSFLLKYRCSECGRESEKYDYCPNCGCRMKGEG